MDRKYDDRQPRDDSGRWSGGGGGGGSGDGARAASVEKFRVDTAIRQDDVDMLAEIRRQLRMPENPIGAEDRDQLIARIDEAIGGRPTKPIKSMGNYRYILRQFESERGLSISTASPAEIEAAMDAMWDEEPTDAVGEFLEELARQTGVDPPWRRGKSAPARKRPVGAHNLYK